jgi:uncharacterized membrane protein YeaQ/YmgE (transglycosylase-associated protein family)
MSLLTYLVLLAASGLLVGALARLALPGPDPMSILHTIGIGILGSMLAGIVSLAFFGRAAGGIVLSVACATLIVYIVRKMRGQSLGSTRQPPGA